MNKFIQRFGIGQRILLGVAVAVVVATLGSIVTVHYLADKNRVQEFRHNMSSLLTQSETMIANMDAMHQAAAFDQPHLLKLAQEQVQGRPLQESYAQTDFYRTIPVVSAWLAVAEAAKQEGYEFFTPTAPGVPARNPKNDHGALFAAAFQAFAAGANEFFSEDPQTGELVLARAIHLNRSCLACHGDPATSPTHNGKDILGFPMEGAKLGELKGAFVLKARMAGDPVVHATVKSMAVVGGIILIGVLGAFHLLNQRLLVNPLRHVITRLDQDATRTGGAVAEIASSSHTLADYASEEAASLEETSASLEEIASMTKRNAESSMNGMTLGRAARAAATVGRERLGEMNRTLTGITKAVAEMQAAVREMQSSSAEVAKIIKTIDEIAFQTNLLALNAAVEAARAGEAGAGFAVVAGEVRSLAQRSAQAAQDTAEKIQGAMKRSETGGVASNKVVASLEELATSAQAIEQVFSGIVGQINSLDEVISQIALASKEQSHGVAEVNAAVAQMDKVTQANAANAEENAGVAEELNHQVDSLRGIVTELQVLILGDRGPQVTGGGQGPVKNNFGFPAAPPRAKEMAALVPQ